MNLIKSFKCVLAGCFGLLVLVPAAFSQDLYPKERNEMTTGDYHPYPHYRESESHPLRIVGYALYPIGWVLREGIFRPISYFASSTPVTRTVMGYREPFDFRGGDCFNADTLTVYDCHSYPPFDRKYDKGNGESETGANTQTRGGELLSKDGRQVYFPDVAFDFGKSGLNDLGRGRVRQVAQLLEIVPDVKIVVTGYADAVGTDEFNLKLGEQRAQSVIKELVELGVDSARLSTVTKGEAEPIFTEEEGWARAVNRRASFTVAAVPSAEAPSSEKTQQQ